MGKGKNYTTSEIEEIRGYLKAGYSNSEIAELTGRSLKAIQQFLVRMNWTHGRFNEEDDADSKQWDEILKKQNEEPKIEFPQQTAEETPEVKQEPDMNQCIQKTKEKTLYDFTPREIIRHLYNLGYRIENGKLICIIHQVVNTKDIING